MKKYWVFFLQNFYVVLAYRLKLGINLVMQLFAPLTMILIFTSVSGSKIAGMTVSEIIVYYITTSFLLLIIGTDVDDYLVDSYSKGEMASIFLKPARYWYIAIVRDLARKLLKLIFIMIIIIPVFILVGWSLVNNLVIAISDIRFLLFFPLSAILIFLISAVVGVFVFWTEDVWGIQHLKTNAILFLGGAALPYQLFPESFRNILYLTPFPYLVSWPFRIINNTLKYSEITIPIFWIITLSILLKYLWKNGVKKFTAFGVY